MIRLDIEALPPSVNDHRKGWRHMHRTTDEWKKLVAIAAHEQGVHGLKLGSPTKPLLIEISYLMAPKTRRDTVSNMEKAVLDALKACGIITDDKHFRRATILGASYPTNRTLIKISYATAPTAEEIIERYRA